MMRAEVQIEVIGINREGQSFHLMRIDQVAIPQEKFLSDVQFDGRISCMDTSL